MKKPQGWVPQGSHQVHRRSPSSAERRRKGSELALKNHRQTSRTKSTTSSNSSAPSGKKWHVRLSPEFTHHQLTPLSHRARWLITVLESLARRNPFTWISNEKLLVRTGFRLTTLQETLRELADEGWIVLVYRDRAKRRRAGIVMMRRTADKVQVADNDERVAEAKAALLARWRPCDGERFYRWRNSGISDDGFTASPDSAIPPQNKEEIENKEEVKKEEGAQPLSLRETTLPDDGSPASTGLSKEAESLAKRLRRLAASDSDKPPEGSITSAADWLSALLFDEHSHANYCALFRRVAKGTLDPAIVLQAFDFAYVKAVQNEIRVMGSAFFASIQSGEARAVTDEELVGESARRDPVVYDDIMADPGDEPYEPGPGIAASKSPRQPAVYKEPPADRDRDNPPAITPGQGRAIETAVPEPVALPFEGPTLGQHLDEVRGRVLEMLDDTASVGPRIREAHIARVARMIQELMAGCNQGPASRRFLNLVEAVSRGYPVGAVAEHFDRRVDDLGEPEARDMRDHLMKGLDAAAWLRLDAPPKRGGRRVGG